MSAYDDARIRDGAILFLVAMETLRMCEKVHESPTNPATHTARITAATTGLHLRRALNLLGLDHPTDPSYAGLLPISLKVCELVAELDYVGIVMES